MDRPDIVINTSLVQHSRPWITDKDKESVDIALGSGMISKGNLVINLGDSMCEFTGSSHSIATTNGTAALILAMISLGAEPGTEVILPTYVCDSVLDAVQETGATPVVCDVGENWVMTSKEVGNLVSDKTVAIIAVHIFGLPVDIMSLKEFGFPVIEDACQAFGMKVNGKYAGTIGDIGIFSFHPTKCLTTAEGGMMVWNDSSVSESIELGIRKLGPVKYRLLTSFTDLQASLGLSQLTRYEEFIERRLHIKKRYLEAFAQFPGIESVLREVDYLFRFPVRTGRVFEDLMKEFENHNVIIRKGVDALLHRNLGLPDSSFPNAVEAFNTTISIPYYPALNDSEVRTVIASVRKILQ